jgi:hypothetical protein
MTASLSVAAGGVPRSDGRFPREEATDLLLPQRRAALRVEFCISASSSAVRLGR